jgi:hypothetical protein
LHSHSHPALAQLTCSFIFLFSLFTLYFCFFFAFSPHRLKLNVTFAAKTMKLIMVSAARIQVCSTSPSRSSSRHTRSSNDLYITTDLPSRYFFVIVDTYTW